MGKDLEGFQAVIVWGSARMPEPHASWHRSVSWFKIPSGGAKNVVHCPFARFYKTHAVMAWPGTSHSALSQQTLQKGQCCGAIVGATGGDAAEGEAAVRNDPAL